ncbi:COR domain-containing protein [Candidatus Electrothrix sp.]|uniref:COR domain-containing protein n=1 Tax=Candidatus Electrothrix sp. TaxID=2170559 RepID=UPI0040569F96
MLITTLSASIYILTLKQEQRRAIQLQEIIKLSLLTQLDLSDKGLTKLPPELFRLTKLTYLEVLNLSGNQLAMFPPEISELTNLTRLDLSNNQLTALPPNLLQLTNLAILNLSGNKLTTLPPELFELANLTRLNLSGNQLTSLPPDILQLKNLTELDLSNNQFTTLPLEVTRLTKLEKLYLKGCPLTSPPAEIAQQGIEAVRSYFVSLKEEVQPLNEVKVILVGDGAAGKTSLVKRLFGEAFDQCEPITHGINIRNWQVHAEDKAIKVNIWDFGGQEIMHATHQFFLSKRSLYVLVLDGRRDERPEYWLRHVESFGGDSPVLIILNKQDVNPGFDLNRPFLLTKYPAIRGFYRTSCATTQGIEKFREILLNELAMMPLAETRWPKSWFHVKEQIENLNKPYISSNEYATFCKKAGITEDNNQEVLVDFLNDLGVVVHFKDFILDAMHILQPTWVTNAVYKLINAEQVAANKGILDLDSLSEILRHGHGEGFSYPPQTHLYIMHLMEKFELCYSISKGSVLIPQLLHVVEPNFSFDYDSALGFALHYPDFLPPSVFPRFMVKVHKDIHENTCWRTGVLLKDKRSGAQALVKEDVEARRINLWVQGERPREYLHYLRYLLTDINSSFEKLSVSERVPMPDDPQRTVDYETLLKYAERGIERYIPEGSDQDYSVDELLGLVQPKDRDELLELAKKVDPQNKDKEFLAELLTGIVPSKVTVLGITFNLSELFRRIQAREKQKRRQGR